MKKLVNGVLLLALFSFCGLSSSAMAERVNPFIGCPGDANQNGKVTVYDLQKFSQNIGKNIPNLDLNADGVVMPQDRSIAKSVIGLCRDRADLNGDGIVDSADLNIVMATYGQLGGKGDANHDGKVNMRDINFVQKTVGVLSTFHHCDADLDKDQTVGKKDLKSIKGMIVNGDLAGDLNHDLFTDVRDLHFLQGASGKSCASSWIPQ